MKRNWNPDNESLDCGSDSPPAKKLKRSLNSHTNNSNINNSNSLNTNKLNHNNLSENQKLLENSSEFSVNFQKNENVIENRSENKDDIINNDEKQRENDELKMNKIQNHQKQNQNNMEIDFEESLNVLKKGNDFISFFNKKLILAPMVRIGTYPMRLLSVYYNCNIVFNQEIIDYKVCNFKRIINTKHECIDFVTNKNPNKIEFRSFKHKMPNLNQLLNNDNNKNNNNKNNNENNNKTDENKDNSSNFSNSSNSNDNSNKSNNASDLNNKWQQNLGHMAQLPQYEPVIFQIGSCSSQRCLKSLNIIGNDIFGIDLNMGCPKSFSLKGGMGAALLSKPDIVEDIIKTIYKNFGNILTFSCKIRLLENDKDTIELINRILKCCDNKINAITIHARYIKDRPKDIARVKKLAYIKEHIDKTNHNKTAIVYNGDIFGSEDIRKAYEITNCDSLMIARGAEWNASIFDCMNRKNDYEKNNGNINSGCGGGDGGVKNTLQPLYKVMNEYIKISECYNNLFANSKYALVKMVTGRHFLCKSDVSKQAQAMKTFGHAYNVANQVKKIYDCEKVKGKNDELKQDDNNDKNIDNNNDNNRNKTKDNKDDKIEKENTDDDVVVTSNEPKIQNKIKVNTHRRSRWDTYTDPTAFATFTI